MALPTLLLILARPSVPGRTGTSAGIRAGTGNTAPYRRLNRRAISRATSTCAALSRPTGTAVALTARMSAACSTGYPSSANGISCLPASRAISFRLGMRSRRGTVTRLDSSRLISATSGTADCRKNTERVEHHVGGVAAHRGDVLPAVLRGEHVQVGDDEEALVPLVQPDPVGQAADVVAQVQPPGRAVPGQHAWCHRPPAGVCGGRDGQGLSGHDLLLVVRS